MAECRNNLAVSPPAAARPAVSFLGIPDASVAVHCKKTCANRTCTPFPKRLASELALVPSQRAVHLIVSRLAMNRLNMIAQQLVPAPTAGAAFLHTMIRVVKL